VPVSAIAVGWCLVVAEFVPAGDAVVVLGDHGSRAAALGGHAAATATAAAVLDGGLGLLLG
jgi:hypothetical protein